MLARALLLAFMTLAAVVAGGPVRADVAGRVSAQVATGYGRVVFTFDRMPKYQVRASTGVVVIEFAEKVDLTLPQLAVDLKPYISAARLDPDGRALRLALAQKVAVNTMEAAEQLYVDFLSQDWSGLPPGLPKEVVALLARRAKEAEEEAKRQALIAAGLADLPSVKVEVGQHPTFSRISFGWDRNVDAKLTREPGEVTIAFTEKGKVDLTQLKGSPPRFVQSASDELTLAGLIVRLAVDRTAAVRTFTEGHAYVVDVAGGADVLAGDKGLVSIGGDAGNQPLPGEGAGPVTDLGGEASKADTTPVAPVEAKPAGVNVALEPFEPGALTPDAFADWARSNIVPGSNKPVQDTVNNTEKHIGGMSDSVRATGVRVGDLGSGDVAVGAAGSDRDESAGAAGEARGERVKVQATRIGKSVRLTFPFPRRVSASVFSRADTIWAVFDSDIPIDTGNLAREFSDRLSDVTLTRSGGMQYLRIKLAKPALMTAAAESSLWVVSIGDMVLEPTRPLALRRTLGNDARAIVTVTLDDIGDVHWLRDPDVGDVLAVVTAYGPPRGLIKSQDFVEFNALVSAHGLAIRPIADDLRVSTRINEVVISRAQGLFLSAGGVQQYVPGRSETSDGRRAGFIDFNGIRDAGPAKFTAARQQLESQAAMANDELRVPAQLTLARFYTGYGLAAEALGVLGHMVAIDSDIEQDPTFNATRAIANILMGRPDEARKDLTVHGLSQSPDISLWRGLVELAAGNWREAQLAIRAGEDVISEYPDDLAAKFRLAGARAALEVRDLADAAYQLEALPPPGERVVQAAEARLLRGRYLDEVGRTEDALAAYGEAMASEIRPVAAEALFYKTALLHKLERIDDKQATDQLETLAVAWRGDNTELGVLNSLARLHVEQGNYRRAFEMMRMATLIDGDSDITRHIQDRMASVFQDLFLNGKADDMPPVDALSLYYDFRDLTPVGRLGDEMIRRLADRLLDMDLPDQAAELLTHQVDNRLRGAARAQVAARLAYVHLLNHQPAAGLLVLQRTRATGLPNVLQRQRNVLEARALAETGRVDLAMELLDTMQGGDIELLKADTLWFGRKWQQAAEQIERLLGDRWTGKEALDAEHRHEVLRAAIAYSLAEDQLGLGRLRSKFAAKMSESPDAHTFEVVTQPVEAKGEEFGLVAKEIASVDSLEAFLGEFRKRYENGAAPAGDGVAPPS